MTNKNQPRAKGVPAAMQKPLLLSLCMSMCAANLSWAENPIISQTYTADPAARVYNEDDEPHSWQPSVSSAYSFDRRCEHAAYSESARKLAAKTLSSSSAGYLADLQPGLGIRRARDRAWRPFRSPAQRWLGQRNGACLPHLVSRRTCDQPDTVCLPANTHHSQPFWCWRGTAQSRPLAVSS